MAGMILTQYGQIAREHSRTRGAVAGGSFDSSAGGPRQGIAAIDQLRAHYGLTPHGSPRTGGQPAAPSACSPRGVPPPFIVSVRFPAVVSIQLSPSPSVGFHTDPVTALLCKRGKLLNALTMSLKKSRLEIRWSLAITRRHAADACRRGRPARMPQGRFLGHPATAASQCRRMAG